MCSRFKQVHSKWLERTADPRDVEACVRWLDGEEEPRLSQETTGEASEEGGESVERSRDKTDSDSRVKRTKKLTLSPEEQPPYRPFCRYVVEKQDDCS